MIILFYVYLVLLSLNNVNARNSKRKVTKVGGEAISWDPDPKDIIGEIAAFFDMLQPHTQNTEDITLNATDLASKYGYKTETYSVMTEDYYVLTMFRIPSTGPPVFLMHGLFCSADDWLIAGPESALAYLLASKGFDVWIGNARGNKYSKSHMILSPNQTEFWEFSWDEIGRYDLPALIDQVLYTTNQSQLTYIGHSQGTTTFFVMASEKPEYNQKIKTMVALSPVAWVGNAFSPLAKLIAPFAKWSWILNLVNFNLIIDNLKNIESAICGFSNGIICQTVAFAIVGFDYEQVNITNTLAVFGHTPSSASLFQVAHYLQNFISKNFLRYDYGAIENMIIYGTPTPPRYKVENIKAPVALFYAENDWLSNIKDVLTLKDKLQYLTMLYRIPYKKFNHLDFLYAKDVTKLVYSQVLDLLHFDSITNKELQKGNY